MNLHPRRRFPFAPFQVVFALLLSTTLLRPGPAESAEPLILRQTVEVRPEEVRLWRNKSVDFVSLKGGAPVAPEGSPDLPALPVRFRLPEDMEIESVRLTVLDSQTLRGRFQVAPVLTRSSDGTFHPEGVGTPALDPAGFFPAEPAQVGLSGRLRGRSIGCVALTPFRYREEDGRLDVLTRVELEVHLKPVTRDRSSDFVPLRAEPWADEVFEDLLGELVMNPGESARLGGERLSTLTNSGAPFAPTFRPSVNGSPVEYVIITDEAQQAQYQRLADWKTRSGIPTVVRTVSWIKANYPNGADVQETIRNFIRDAAQKWGTIWILLGADTGIIPTRYGRTLFFGGEYIPTDLYYQCVDGTWNKDGDKDFGEGYGSPSIPGDDADLYPEVWLGRIPTNNVTEATTVMNKILAYETNPVRNGYQKTHLALAEVLFPQVYSPGDSILFDGAEVAEDAIGYLPPWTSVTKLYEHCPYPAWPTCILENKPTVIDSINAGFGFVHHVGHGYINTMAVGVEDKALSNADADAANNGNETFFLYAINCTSSAIDFNCIAERYLLNSHGGTIASVGSTRFDFPSTGWSYQNEFFRLVYQVGITQIGKAAAMCKLPFIGLALQDNTHRWTQFTQIYFGDPSMPLWTNAPRDLTVSHNANHTLGTGTYLVHVTDLGSPLDSAKVCLNKAGDEYVMAYTNVSGDAVIPFVPDSTGTFQVTVSKQNYVPYQANATVVAPGTPYLYAQDQLIDDDGIAPSTGNSDQKIDAGEVVELKLPLKNRGGSTSGSVTATLSSLSSHVTVIDGSSTYPLIAGGATVNPTDGFVLAISRLAPDRTEAKVHLTYVSGATNIQEDVILYVHAPVFEWYRSFPRDTTGTGNSNGVIEPNEDVALRVELRNGGLGQARLVTARLRSTDPVFTVTDSVVNFGTIAGGTRAVSAPAPDTFRFRMSDTTGVSTNVHRLKVYLFDNYSLTTPLAIFTLDPKGPAAAPANVIATGSTASIALTFDVMTVNDLRGYNIYRSTSAGGPFTRINQYTTIKHAYYDDEGLPPLSVFYYKVAAQDSAGIEGPQSIAVSGSTTLPIHSGFPVELESATNASVTLADVNYDGDLEVVVGASEIYVMNADGTELVDGDNDIRTLGPLTNTGNQGDFWNAPAVGDVNRDGSPEVAAISWTGYLYLWSEPGETKPGFPINLNVLNQFDINPLGSVAMADVNGDGDLEIFCIVGRMIFGFHHNGTEIIDGDANPATLGVFKATATPYSYGTPALADLTGDGLPEVIAGTRDGKLYVMNAMTGASLPGFPYTTASNITSSPAVGDIDNDGLPEIVFGSSDNKVYALNPDGTAVTGWPQGIQLQEDIYSSPALGDLTGDGIPDVVIGASNGRVYAWRNTGVLVPGWPVFIKDNLGNFKPVRSSPILVDIDNNGVPEVTVGDQIGRLHCFYASGLPVPGFPIQTGNLIEGGPAAWDIDNDGLTEIVAESFDQKIYTWDTPWTFNRLASPWPMFHHDPRHTGSLAEPLLYQSAAPETPGATRPFVLHQNQPNPFNPTTLIRYSIEAAPVGGLLPVRLEIFSSTGRLVKVLVDRPMPPGNYEVGWDGRDGAGIDQASGIYFYRISTPSGVESRKMTMAR
jgi:hypothetical protein